MNHSVETHFDGQAPVVRDIYETIVAAARELGPVDEDPKKTSIHLNRRSAFAGVKTRRKFLILTVKATADIDNSRISKRERASAKRWYHEIKLSDTGEIDSQILAWLRDSYELSG